MAEEIHYLVQTKFGNYDGISGDPNTSAEHHLIGVHRAQLCEPRNCAIHNNPSLHPLTMEPLVWNPETSAVQRQCSHKVIHPDVDDLNYRKTVGQYYLYLEHDCDGCCGLEQPDE